MPKVQTRWNRRRLVSDLLEVLSQLDDRVVGGRSRDAVGMVSDEKCLCGLVGNNAFFALL